MPLLTRFYETKDDALQALGELKRRGLRESAAHIVDNTGPASEAALAAKGVHGRNAEEYAERVKNGLTLLIVDAPYAGTAIAEEILDRPRPNDKAKVLSNYENMPDEAAPLSSTLGLPVLSENPAPLSSLFGLPVLSREKSSPATYGKPMLSDSFFPTAALGPLLTKSSTPSGFGFALLANNGKPYSFGLPLLANNGKPLGFGLPLIADSEPVRRK